MLVVVKMPIETISHVLTRPDLPGAGKQILPIETQCYGVHGQLLDCLNESQLAR